MSVLKAHRSESKAEFVNVANKIYIQTMVEAGCLGLFWTPS